jgi:hypothetical protein
MNLIMIGFQLALIIKSYINSQDLIDLIDQNSYSILVCLFGCTFVFCVLGMLSSAIEYIKHKASQ